MQTLREVWEEITLEPLKSCSPSDKLIWWHMRINGEGKYSITKLAAALGFATKTVRDALTNLEDHELIVKVGHRSGPIAQTIKTRSPREILQLNEREGDQQAAD
jgi:DeoR/GlpR family transcriptional regulator of sugar metabolism